jgi:hypothetical protein
MRLRRLSLLVVLASFSLASSPPGPRAADGWQILAPGIEYRAFTLPGPVRAFVARMDRDEPSVTIDTMVARGPSRLGTETVSDMASRYHQALETWNGTWGGRSRVVAAINGSFFDPETGVPDGGQVQSGAYRGWVGNPVGPLAFGWTMDRQAHLGVCTYLPPDKQLITHLASGETQLITAVNITPERSDLILYTPEFTSATPGTPGRLEVVIDMSRPALFIPPPRTVIGVVRELRDGAGAYALAFDQVVLSAAGSARETLLANARPGSRIGIAREVVDLGTGCRNQGASDWTKVYASLSGGPIILLEGEIVPSDRPGAEIQDPRTAVCFGDEWIYFVVVDGRDPSWSQGMTFAEVAAFCRDRLNARWGVNQDGGGSSTMWINGMVANRPSDGSERRVANGLMMVVHEPEERSSSYRAYDMVTVTQASSLRLGPGTNYATRSTLPAGIAGRIQQPLSQVNGVLAKGVYWWRVAFGRTLGWIAEDTLMLQPEDAPRLLPDVWPEPAR